MFTKHLKRLLVLILVCTLAGTSAFAKSSSNPQSETQAAMEYGNSLETTAQPHDKLRADVQKLIAEAKAGKVAPTARPQIQPAKSNNLSKGAKIAIGVGIAVVVIAIFVKYQKDHFFDCKSRCVL
jgi:hypothetical protein